MGRIRSRWATCLDDQAEIRRGKGDGRFPAIIRKIPRRGKQETAFGDKKLDGVTIDKEPQSAREPVAISHLQSGAQGEKERGVTIKIVREGSWKRSCRAGLPIGFVLIRRHVTTLEQGFRRRDRQGAAP